MSPQHKQRMTALKGANDVRTKRKDLKQSIAIGKTDARKLLAAPPPYAASMKLSTLLESVPKIGRVKAQKIIRSTAQRDLPLAKVSPVTAQRIADLLPT